MITTTRIEDTSLNLLRKLSKDHRRSMTQELSVLIEAAVMEFKIFGHDEVIASRDNTEPPKPRRAEAPAAKPNNFNTLQKKSAK